MRYLIPFAGKDWSENTTRQEGQRRGRGPTRRPQHGAREKLELVTGQVYFSDDNWVTVWKQLSPKHMRVVRSKSEADRVRYLAVVQHGGGRDE